MEVTNSIPVAAPLLSAESSCYFHQRMLRTVKSPPQSRVHHAALLEDEESIQTSLMEVVNALLRGTIEVKRAELVLRALNTAVRNARRAKFGNYGNMVTQIPDYAPPPPTDDEVAEAAETARLIEAARQASRAEIARIRAEDEQPSTAATTASPRTAAQVATAHVGTVAPVRPSGPTVPGRSAVQLNSHTMPSTKVKATVPDPTSRKPPQSARSAAPAPKERKITAHRASGG